MRGYYKRRPAAERFWAKVDKSGECWLWIGWINSGGYGMFGHTYAHRWVYEHEIGLIPAGMQIDHVKERGCAHRNCVRAAHLEAVTPRENSLRSESLAAHNARKTHCREGHPFDERNTVRWPHDPSKRHCRICHIAKTVRSQRKHR